MLTHEDNETLVRVGPQAPMGQLFRRFWLPFYLAKDLVTGGQPKRVRLLGEDLVVFRNTEGVVGLLDNACPHRGAPLVFARNEECGLRCVYHGWKFEMSGAITDMPAEPANSRFKERLKIKAYPCRERNGIIWAYMGPDNESPPPLPDLEWNMVADEQVHVSLRIQECNWLQALEGDIDSAHAAFLHGRIDSEGRMKRILAVKDRRPTFDVQRQDFGLSIAAKRKLENGNLYWRVNQFVMPFYTLTPPQSSFPELTGHAWVPMDDEHTIVIMFSYHPDGELYEKTRRLFEEGYKGRETGHPSRDSFRTDVPANQPYAAYWSKYNPENDFQFDYESQTKVWFSGLPGLWVQDAGLQAGLGPVYDRTRENLGVSDSGIVATRRLMLELAKNLRDRGVAPAIVNEPSASMVRAVSLQLPPEATWHGEEGKRHMRAELGKGFGYTP